MVLRRYNKDIVSRLNYHNKGLVKNRQKAEYHLS